MQSNGVFMVGLNIFLCMVLGFRLSMVRYFVIAFLQLMAVCLDVILWASVLASLPMVANSSVHFWASFLLVGVGGMVVLLRVCSCVMSR